MKPEEALKRNAFEVADARQALKVLGANYVTRFPKSPHTLEVKFNIARAYYEDGDYAEGRRAVHRLRAGPPATTRTPAVAGNLALDSLRQLNDFKGLEETGQKFLAAALPAKFHDDVRKILTQSKAEALDELALKSAEETGDVVVGLLKVADENKNSEIGEKALYGAFTAAREKRDMTRQRELGTKLVADYPKSQYLSDVLLTLGRHAAEAAAFGEAAGWFEQVGQKLAGDVTGLDGYLSAARLRLAMGDYKEAARTLELASETAGARKTRCWCCWPTRSLKLKDYAGAKRAAESALALDKLNTAAAAVIAEVQATTAPGEPPEKLIAMLTTAVQGPNGQTEEAAKGLWFLGEILYRSYKGLPADKVEEKVAALQELEGIYTQAASLGYPEWAVASLWKLAPGVRAPRRAWWTATAAPAGMSAAEAKAFQAAVKEQVAPLQGPRAEEAFKACLSPRRAARGVQRRGGGLPHAQRDGGAAGARARGSRAQPGAGGARARRSRPRSPPSRSRRWAWRTWRARQYGLAQLTFGRVTELQDTRARLALALGWALLNQGDAMGAARRLRQGAGGGPHVQQGPPQPGRAALPLRRRRGRPARAVRAQGRGLAGRPGRGHGLEGVQVSSRILPPLLLGGRAHWVRRRVSAWRAASPPAARPPVQLHGVRATEDDVAVRFLTEERRQRRSAAARTPSSR